MAVNLIKMVDTLRDDLKATYLKNPTVIWDLPVIALSQAAGSVSILDGIKGDDHVVAWLKTHMQGNIENICVGRMVAKHSTVVDGEGNPIIKEKAIMVMGRTMSTGRTYVSITPCMEHRDYRCDQTAERQNKKFDPTLKGADKTKNIVDEETNKVVGRLQAKFGEEQIMDSTKGQEFLSDPIIEGVVPAKRNLDQIVAENMNAPDKDKITKGLF